MTSAETSRWREIEKLSDQARIVAKERLAEIDIALNRETDIRLVATVIAAGAVDPVPNLTRQGERLAGFLEWTPRAGNIFFEAYDPLVRQRFSIAHELGHYFLHAHLVAGRSGIHVDPQEKVQENESDDTYRPAWEKEADAFAAAFLLPQEEVEADLAYFGPAVPFLAERYQVAEATLRRRLRTLEMLHA